MMPLDMAAARSKLDDRRYARLPHPDCAASAVSAIGRGKTPRRLQRSSTAGWRGRLRQPVGARIASFLQLVMLALMQQRTLIAVASCCLAIALSAPAYRPSASGYSRTAAAANTARCVPAIGRSSDLLRDDDPVAAQSTLPAGR